MYIEERFFCSFTWLEYQRMEVPIVVVSPVDYFNKDDKRFVQGLVNDLLSTSQRLWWCCNYERVHSSSLVQGTGSFSSTFHPIAAQGHVMIKRRGKSLWQPSLRLRLVRWHEGCAGIPRHQRRRCQTKRRQDNKWSLASRKAFTRVLFYELEK